MMTLAELNKQFSKEEACLDYLVALRWPKGEVRCPRCGNEKVYKLSRAYRWQCKGCAKNGYRFSPIAGTIFENTNIPLKTWFQVVYLMCQSKKGISALQIHRMIGTGSYRTAWYMCHRIRAMRNETFDKLTGVVEVDETYVGGKAKNLHVGKKPVKKTAVIGAIARKGNVVCQVIEETDRKTMQDFVSEAVSDKVSLISTDEHQGYAYLDRLGFRHDIVNHSNEVYVKQTVFGAVHTANIDSFWSLIKRGIVGTFHKISKDYLPLYLAEFSFRHNERENPDIFASVIAGC